MADNFSDAIKGMLMGENELLTAAVNMHNMYEAYIKAGFTKKQAMELLIGMIRPVPNNQRNKI